MSRVSVIIPSYNREKLLRDTLANLLAQSRPPYEIIVVDDGSTDGSVDVIRSFGPGVKLLQQKNQGPGAARNAGLKIARGDFIQFQDSDDLLSLNKLETQARILENTGADICLGPWAHVIINGWEVSFETCVLQQRLPPSKVSFPGWMLRGWFTVFQSLMFRRNFLLSAGSYETDTRYGEDMEFFFRMLMRSPKVAFCPDVMTLYRVNSVNNLSSDGGAPNGRRVVDWARCLQRMDRNCGQATPGLDALSRACFLAGMRKHSRYLRMVPDASPELIQDLSHRFSQMPSWFLGAIELWLRADERWRLFRTGQRWMTGLQAGAPTKDQRRFISELGFSISA